MNLRSKKGAAIVEAAILYPIAVLTVAALIYMVVSLFITIYFQCSLDSAVREAGGHASGTVYYGEYERSESLYSYGNHKIAEEKAKEFFSKEISITSFQPRAPQIDVKRQLLHTEIQGSIERPLGGNFIFSESRVNRLSAKWNLINEAQWIRNQDLVKDVVTGG